MRAGHVLTMHAISAALGAAVATKGNGVLLDSLLKWGRPAVVGRPRNH